ncbi:MAG: stage V sporulation protein AB [Eubacterium sp.]|nr:stage V sporulation protein AB [Eubacterium sp.]
MSGYMLLGFLGVCGGTMIAAGLCALITSTGIVTRMADKSHTASRVRIYESILMMGAIFWNGFWIVPVKLRMAPFMALALTGMTGVLQGIFVGCLAVSLAETLNGTAIFSRRAKLSKGVGIIILFTAFGKTIFALFQFVL